MISFHEAESLCQNLGEEANLGQEDVSLAEVVGRVVAQDICAQIDIQPFDNSAMDGFAVRLDELKGANSNQRVMLPQVGIIAAEPKEKVPVLQHNTCMKIMTGAPVPLGADAVVPVEWVQMEGKEIFFSGQPEPFQHIRKAGADFKKGQTVISAGQKIRARHILPLACLGIGRIRVFKKPTFFFVSTGRELVDNLSAPLATGQIYNSNAPYALGVLKEMGLACQKVVTIADDPAEFDSFLMNAVESNPSFIISSGAVSVGDFDFVRAGLEKAGAKILYHKIRIKPGKPNLLARLPNGTIYFGLPGNPVATAVGLRFFVAATVRGMMGSLQEDPFYARSFNGFSRNPGLHLFLKGRYGIDQNGCCRVSILPGQESFMVSPFLESNCWIELPEHQAEIRPEESVRVYPFCAD